jgi:glycine betaine/choline ABC-type transport system substrate-binding protein
MTSTYRRILTMLAVACLALGVAACGDDDKKSSSGDSSSSSDGKAIQRDAANASKGTIAVGSKNFTEQFVLGEVYAQALEAQGFKVKRRLNLGSEQVAFKALKSGDIDMYPEYTGTALINFFDVKPADVPKEPDTAYNQAKADYQKEGITALAHTPFSNTYVITSTKKTADKIGNPKTMTELFAGEGKNLSLSGFPECRQRKDCLLGMQSQFGYKGKFISSDGKFNDLDQGNSELTLAFGTDPQLALTDKYTAYTDDKKFFPPYNITLGVRDATFKKIGPDAVKVLESVQEPMTEEVMRELNRRVELEKQEPKAVAAAYLKEEGFVK